MAPNPTAGPEQILTVATQASMEAGPVLVKAEMRQQSWLMDCNSVVQLSSFWFLTPTKDEIVSVCV